MILYLFCNNSFASRWNPAESLANFTRGSSAAASIIKARKHSPARTVSIKLFSSLDSFTISVALIFEYLLLFIG